MSRRPVYALAVLAAAAVVAPSAHSQAVVSTRAGLVHFFDGAVFVAGQPLEARLGVFASIPEGAELRTEKGRAEILLTPGVFLRVGENSSIRLLSNVLPDARVEVLGGSAILDSGDPAPGTAVTLIYKDWSIRQDQGGSCRIDTAPPRLVVRAGEAKVTSASGTSVSVTAGMDLPFGDAPTPEQLSDRSGDAFSDWADGRTQSISADNQIAANIQDPANMNSGADLYSDAFTYYPMLGMVPYAYAPSTGLYGYQAGFYSMYLPGYVSMPLFLRTMPFGGLGASGLYRPPITHIGVTPLPTVRVMPVGPASRTPIVRPVAPAPIRGGTIHVGGHR